MLDYQRQNSPQTLEEGIAEYYAANASHLATRFRSSEADDFFRSHDASHVVFGCGVSLCDELIVKISSLFGTTQGWRVLKGYRLPESKLVYQGLQLSDIVLTTASSIYLVPRTIWRCMRMHERWRWNDFDSYLNVPLHQVRAQYGIRVAH